MQMVALDLESRDLCLRTRTALAKPKGEFVELAFPTNNAAVQGMAEIGFIALEDEASNSLQMALEALQDRLTAGGCLRRG